MSDSTTQKSISVIVPFYKGHKYVSGLLYDLVEATKSADLTVEVLFINDNPEEKITIEDNCEGFCVNVINSEINRGIHGARVYGLSLASGDYVLFLDQDDRIFPDFFLKQFSVLGEGEAVVCNAYERGRKKYGKHCDIKNVNDLNGLLECGNPIISPGQVIIKKDAIPFLWRENVIAQNGADDWLLWILFLNEGHRFELNKEVLFEHTVDGNNASTNEKMMSRSEKELLHICLENHVLSRENEDRLRCGILRLDENRLENLQREKALTFLFTTWINSDARGNGPIDYLQSNGIYEFAIYGAGNAGISLKNEAEAAGICVRFFIDRMANHIVNIENVKDPDDEIPSIGLIVVALATRNVLVEVMLRSKTNASVISLQEILGIN